MIPTTVKQFGARFTHLISQGEEKKFDHMRYLLGDAIRNATEDALREKGRVTISWQWYLDMEDEEYTSFLGLVKMEKWVLFGRIEQYEL